MKIKVEKWIIDEDVSFKIVDIEKCCDKLINSNYIDINNECEEDGNDYNNYTVKMHRDEFYDSYGEDFYHDYYETINYCPFCGSLINIEIVNTIDKIEEYKELRKQSDSLWKKSHETDSKKESLLLQAQAIKIDNKTNNILTSNSFKDYLGRK